MDKQQESMIKHLRELVSIESVSGEAEGDYPFGKGPYDALVYTLNLCRSLGFITKQCGNHCGYAQIGDGEEIFAILVHLDIVPAGTGWNTNPYDVTVVGDKLFGRGVIDDKGPAIAVIYAMKEILDSGVKLNRRIRIIFGTTEETGDGEDLQVYKEQEELPTLGFTPDADFPVVYLEKGIAEIQLLMDCDKAGIVEAVGGNAPNMVADGCELTCVCNGVVKQIESIGKSAHGSMPWLGENAIGKAMIEANQWAIEQGGEIPFARFYEICIGMSYNGAGLHCDFTDEDSGETTVNLGMIEVIDSKVVVTLDIRAAITCDSEKLLQTIQEATNPYGVEVQLTYWADAIYMDKNCEFVQDLMEVYRSVTGREEQPLVMGGGTYARSMDNIVAFGPTFPGRECTEHQPNEYIYIEDLFLGKDIYREAILKMCRG